MIILEGCTVFLLRGSRGVAFPLLAKGSWGRELQGGRGCLLHIGGVDEMGEYLCLLEKIFKPFCLVLYLQGKKMRLKANCGGH